MKQMNRYIFAFTALLATATLAFGQEAMDTYKTQNNVSTGKSVSGPDANGQYTISLETFATGSQVLVEKGVPADIVLVLDVSGSMDENMTTYTYTEVARDWTYNNFGNSTYYYLDGTEYRAVSRATSGRTNTQYYLRYRDANNNWTDLGSRSTSQTNVLWSGTLYSRSTETKTKMTALKDAVKDFIDEIHKNDLYNSNGEARETPLGNQIAIVKFAEPTYYTTTTGWIAGASTTPTLSPGNHFATWRSNNNVDEYSNFSTTSTGEQRYNCTEVVAGFSAVSSTSDVNNLKNTVNGLVSAGSTAADYGMTLAKMLIDNLGADRSESTKTVVFFTDGSPTHASGFETAVANTTISNAKEIKDKGATVFSVGVFANLSTTEAANVNKYMGYTSSNYPNATSMTAAGTGGNDEAGYYQNASGADLSAIFKNIAQGAGGSDESIDSSTEVRDVVSSSFALPDGASESDIHVYTSAISSDGKTWGTRVAYNDATIEISGSKVSVTGFDYAADDNSGTIRTRRPTMPARNSSWSSRLMRIPKPPAEMTHLPIPQNLAST